jgi:DNA-binding NtrC family response regulator
MTTLLGRQTAIALVDDDYHSARLMTRMIAAHDGPSVTRFGDAREALVSLMAIADHPTIGSQCMVLADLKSSSSATLDFVLALKQNAPRLLVVAMAPTLDREVRNALIDAGAAAVFERQADLNLYRREAASIVSFWARSQRLDAVGT